MKIAIALLMGIMTPVVGWLGYSAVEDKSFGAFSDPFLSIQLADSPQANYILSTDGTDNSWIVNSGGGGGGGGIFSTTTAGLAYQNSWEVVHGATATSTDGVTLEVNGLFFSDNATTTLLTATTQWLTNLVISGDTINDFAGDGLTVTGNALTADLGTDIVESELSINAPTDLYMMVASSSATGGWEWMATSSALLNFGSGGGAGHDAVTLAGTPNYLTLSGQEITLTALDLADDINTFTEAQLETAVSDDNPLFDGDLGGSVQAWDAELDTIAALTETNGNVMFVAGGVWTSDATPAIDCADCTGIVTAGITDGTILEADLNISNSGTDNYVLTYNSAGSNFTWAADATGDGIATTSDSVGLPGTAEDVGYFPDDFMIGGSASNTAEFLFDPEGSQLIIASSTAATSTITDNSGNDAVRLMESDGEGIEFDFGTAGDLVLTGISSVAEIVTALNVTLTGILDLTSATVNFGADAIDAITEIASSIKSGIDATLITGTAGTNGNISQWNSDGDLVDASIAASNVGLANGDTWTGVHDYGGASSIELPNSSNPTVNATGEIAFDTSTSSFRFYDGSAERQIKDEFPLFGVSLASSSLEYDGDYGNNGSTTVTRAGYKYGVTLSEVYCKTDTNTIPIMIGDGNSSSTVNCTTSGATDSSPSVVIPSRTDIKIEVGTSTAVANEIYIDVTGRWTAD